MLGIDHQHGTEKAHEPEQIRTFMAASEEIRFEGRNRKEIYDWVRETVVRSSITCKEGQGLLRGFVTKVTGLSRAQVTWLIERWKSKSRIPRWGILLWRGF